MVFFDIEQYLATYASDFTACNSYKILDLSTGDILLAPFGRPTFGCDVGYTIALVFSFL